MTIDPARSRDIRTARNDAEDLYIAHVDEAVRLAFLLTGHQQAAEDLVQDAFIRVFGQLRKVRDPDAFRAYLRRTIVNLSRDRFRRLRTERSHAATRRVAVAGAENAPPAVEEREVLRLALREIPHRQRAALILRFFLDLSEQQTAEVLDCSVPAVKSLVSRGTRGMRLRMRGGPT